jgi:hypothetical protein
VRLIGVTLIPVPIVTMPALAAELPSRKPGLWQVKTSIGGKNFRSPFNWRPVDDWMVGPRFEVKKATCE